jgi:toxin ParE1/3/4
MIFEIEISAQADNDLRNVYEYIAYELQSPENASGQLDRLEESILSLDQMPERFRAYEKEPWHSRGLRIMPVDNYCVLYIPDVEKAVVTIIRVMYGGRDIDMQLQKFTKM